MHPSIIHWAVAGLCLFLASCQTSHEVVCQSDESPLYFHAEDSLVVSISPYDGSCDTLFLDHPLDNIVCLSSTHIAYLDAVGTDSVVTAVSGLNYISNPEIHQRAQAGKLWDIGYEAALDYERLVAIHPDVILAYAISSARPAWMEKLESLGLRVLILYDNMETHPLARASYVRMAGALTGKLAEAEAVYAGIADRYHALAGQPKTCQVLMNVPYGDQWYIPGGSSYMTRLVEDAGGQMLGAVPGRNESSVITLEQALLLAQEADVWLHPGNCRTRAQLNDLNPLFRDFPIGRVYNNTRRMNAGGGNDFWEQGAVRPDLILEDLVRIMQNRPATNGQDDSFNFYIPLN